ncbi:hypothetical protein SAMN05660662_1263 [Blastococcus aurantiacus]|uniref:Fibronectin type-III domain-containing protein n=1 Tax=Blastococcus aurantiacus TaxID=1550231 RepID=A0A1G7J256_9ACTN|nr:hypothetical protein [Blastococcus aurantiacus]SDF18955.1 hypothetical protein SAMN05660662_1263 [Blastococcus aurantiacus]
MNRLRRSAVLLGLTAAVIVGSSIPASATFSESVSTNTAALRTLTVAAPTGLVVDDTCTTTTTTVKRTVYTNPGTGAQTTRYYSSSTTQSTSSTNEDSTTTQTVAGPGPNETTTTTVTKDTDLSVTLRWTASTSSRVGSYLVSAHLGINGSVSPLMTTTSATTSVTQTQDADALAYRPSLSVTTQTTYGWTAASAQTRVLSC